MKMLEEAIQNKAPIIRDCIIGCAAGIDEFIPLLPDQEISDANSYCLHQLILKMAENAVQNQIVDILGDAAISLIGVPGIDVAMALGLAGYD